MVHKFSYKLSSAGRGYPKVAEWILAMVFVLIVLMSRINVSVESISVDLGTKLLNNKNK